MLHSQWLFLRVSAWGFLSCHTAAPFFCHKKKNSKKHVHAHVQKQQLGTWSWMKRTWEIRFFFRVMCETLQEILEYASGGRQGSPHGISQGLTWAPMAYAVA